MNDNTFDNKKIGNKILNNIYKNLKIIIIILSLLFILFLSFQLYSFYNLNKIKKNSIDFFNSQNLEESNVIKDSIIKLSKENNFYGLLSKLELIKFNIENENLDEVINLYNELLKNEKLDTIYKSSIASRAAYQFIDVNLKDLSKNYQETIKSFINFIDDQLINFQGTKLELNYLLIILSLEKNNNEYENYNDAIDLYNNIMSSDSVSSIIKERVNKIHEYFSYK